MSTVRGKESPAPADGGSAAVVRRILSGGTAETAGLPPEWGEVALLAESEGQSGVDAALANVARRDPARANEMRAVLDSAKYDGDQPAPAAAAEGGGATPGSATGLVEPAPAAATGRAKPARPYPAPRPGPVPSSPVVLPEGKLVKCLDQDNFGRVVEDDGGDRVVVHFVSPEGVEATVPISRDLIREPDGSPVGESARGGEPAGFRLTDPPPVPLPPLGVLPLVVRYLVDAVADSVGAPKDFVLLFALVVLGGAIGRSVKLRLKPDWVVQANLYGLAVGPPSSSKTPALNAVSDPLKKTDAEMHRAYLDEVKDWEAGGKQGLRPTPRALVMSDFTTEAVVARHVNNPRGITVVLDEGAAFFESFDKYRGGRGGDRQQWCSVHSGTPIQVDRKTGDERLVVPNPCVGIVGGIQPDRLKHINSDGANDGLFERFLFVYPDPVPRRKWEDNPEVGGVHQDWDRLVRRIHTIDWYENAVITLDAAAYRVWVGFYDRLVDEVNSDPSDREAALKLVDAAARIALILHVAAVMADPTRDPREPGPEPPPIVFDTDDSEPAAPPPPPFPAVTREAMAAGVELAEYLRGHQQRVRWVMNGGIGNRDARYIVEWLRRTKRPRFSFVEVDNNLRRFRHERDALRAAVEWLEQRGAVFPEPVDPERKGKRLSPAWAVHPDLLAEPPAPGTGAEPSAAPPAAGRPGKSDISDMAVVPGGRAATAGGRGMAHAPGKSDISDAPRAGPRTDLPEGRGRISDKTDMTDAPGPCGPTGEAAGSAAGNAAVGAALPDADGQTGDPPGIPSVADLPGGIPAEPRAQGRDALATRGPSESP